jgi:SprT protein
MVEPIGAEQKSRILDATGSYINQAGRAFSRVFPEIPVLFDLQGTRAGMYKVRRQHRVIRYNPWLFAGYYAENLAVTVPHEVAHYIADMMYGLKSIRAHGREWRSIMSLFQADDSVTADFDLTGIPCRIYKRLPYACACQTHNLTRIRHNRIRQGMRYCCRKCGCELVLLSAT